MEFVAVFCPLIGFLCSALFGKKIGDAGCQAVTCAGLVCAAVASVVLFFTVAVHGHGYTTLLAPWIVSGDFAVNWALRLDSLSVVMMCVINIVSACVHVYSVGYMSHDPAKGRFMAYLSLFTFAMLMLVTADNLLQLFFGWEGVGLASYLLIGFWNHKDSANIAAQKAFVVNRVGDFGLALALMALFVVFGTIDFDAIFSQVPEKSSVSIHFLGQSWPALTVIGLLLFMGAMGKSAQLGLHTWLPDAMEGPTPVSALIHAATMVTAGVFLVARMSPVFEYAPDARMVITVVGACTAFVAATIGLTQFDIKRVIAYSTMSQLGYMFFALGVSAYGAAMFHLVTHAFFKALLFLGAGSVIHAMDGEQDMRRMGGIWKKIPLTYGLMWIGSLALAGIPPFAGFYSKDIVLESAFAAHAWFGTFAFWMAISAAFMTAFYSWRLILMTFHGAPRADHHTMEHAHESPPVMLLPLIVLALGAIFSGMMLYGPFVGEKHVVVDISTKLTVAEREVRELHLDRHTFWGNSIKVSEGHDVIEAAHHVPVWVKFTPLAAGVLGVGLAYLFYLFRTGGPAFMVRMFPLLHTLFFNKWFFDPLYDGVFVRNAGRLGRVFWGVDRNFVDRFGPDGSAIVSRRFAGMLSRFQNGFVYHYAFVMMIAVIGFLTWFLFRFGQEGI